MIGYLLIGGGILVALLGGFGLWEKHRADAAVAERDAIASQLDTCAGANADLTTKFNGLQAEADRFKTAATKAQARAAKAIADAAKRQEADAAELAILSGILASPPSPEPIAGVCARADTILRSVVKEERRPEPPPVVKRGEVNPALAALNLQ